MWTDGEYRNLSKDPEAQHIAYRVEIVSSEALSDAVKAAITDTAEGCELSRVRHSSSSSSGRSTTRPWPTAWRPR